MHRTSTTFCLCLVAALLAGCDNSSNASSSIESATFIPPIAYSDAAVRVTSQNSNFSSPVSLGNNPKHDIRLLSGFDNDTSGSYEYVGSAYVWLADTDPQELVRCDIYHFNIKDEQGQVHNKAVTYIGEEVIVFEHETFKIAIEPK